MTIREINTDIIKADEIILNGESVTPETLEGATGATGPTGAVGATGPQGISGEVTGVMKDYLGTTAPIGYVLASGRTIGSGSSGGTERANADTENLYILLWEAFPNTILPIQDSTGVASTRGASAAADFAANKRLPLPDLRGRVRAGKDNMGGTAASRMTTAGSGIDGTTLGASGGDQTHTLTSAQMPSHTHTQNAHFHGSNIGVRSDEPAYFVRAPNGWEGAGTAKVPGASGSNYTAYYPYTGSATATNQNTGGGGAHNNTQPTFVTNVIIAL